MRSLRSSGSTFDRRPMSKSQALLRPKRRGSQTLTYTDGFGGDINTIQDQHMSSAWPTFNGGIHDAYEFNSAQNYMLMFNLSAIPAAAQCLSATLTLTHDRDGETGGLANCAVYSVLVAN